MASQADRAGDVLLPGTVVDAYVIRRVLGAGGFGVTYLAEHKRLGKVFALKEYFPRGYARRDGDTVSAMTRAEETYQWGLERFQQEARALAKFHHRAIVGVSNVFEANGTAYIVLSYENGRDMRRWQAELGRPPTQAELDRILVDVLDALDELHTSGLLHRDIAPDNIFIRQDGSPVLLDFGAARHSLGEHSAQISAIVKNGFSPPEQYTTEGKSQGPWTDIYALGATLYTLITGKRPPEAAGRMLDDTYVSAAGSSPEGYRPAFLAAVDHALRLSPTQRPRSVDDWRAELFEGAERLATGPVSEPPGRVPKLVLGKGLSSDGPPSTPTSTPAVPSAGFDKTYLALAALVVVCLGAMAAIAFQRPKAIDETAGGSALSRCDQLAAIPLDRSVRSPGIQLEAMDAAAAVAACNRALNEAAGSERPRMQAQLGYALRAAGNLPEAFRLLRQAADAGNAEAQSLYADFLYDGTPPATFDRAAACSLYEQAMHGGSINGASNFAYCTATGQGGRTRDEAAGVTIYRQAADAGSRDAMLLLGLHYRDGHGVPLNVNDAVHWIDKAAALGEARAAYVLADLYQGGYGVEIDKAKAAAFYRQAKPGLERMSQHRHIDATTVLGTMHRDGNGMGADPSEAARLYRVAADLGSANAMNNLADLYAHGSGVPQDLDQAMRLLQTAIARNEDGAMLTLGTLHEDGRGTAQNYAEAMRWYREAAARGNGAAMEKIANLHYDGHGVPVDHKQAMSWFRQAAARGTPSAMNSVGVLTEKGDGVPANPGEARRWYQAAAELGSADAMRNLGTLYDNGTGVAKNGPEAQRWYLKAVERSDDVDAMYSLGELFRNGRGVPVNFPEALKWYRRAVEKDNAESMTALGIMYEEGQGVTQSYGEAARLYKLAADKGSASAMHQLGTLYEAGHGVTADCQQARSWYTKAADAGDPDAKKKVGPQGTLRCR